MHVRPPLPRRLRQRARRLRTALVVGLLAAAGLVLTAGPASADGTTTGTCSASLQGFWKELYEYQPYSPEYVNTTRDADCTGRSEWRLSAGGDPIETIALNWQSSPDASYMSTYTFANRQDEHWVAECTRTVGDLCVELWGWTTENGPFNYPQMTAYRGYNCPGGQLDSRNLQFAEQGMRDQGATDEQIDQLYADPCTAFDNPQIDPEGMQEAGNTREPVTGHDGKTRMCGHFVFDHHVYVAGFDAAVVKVDQYACVPAKLTGDAAVTDPDGNTPAAPVVTIDKADWAFFGTVTTTDFASHYEAVGDDTRGWLVITGKINSHFGLGVTVYGVTIGAGTTTQNVKEVISAIDPDNPLLSTP